MIRPWSLHDKVWDFGPNQNYYENFNVFLTFPLVSQPARFYFYKLPIDGNITANYWIRNTNTGDVTFTQVPQGLFNAGPLTPLAATNYYGNTTRRILRPGVQKDEITYYSSQATSGYFWNQRDYGLFSYYYFQQAVAILKETTTVPSGTVIVSGSSKNISLNDVLTFDISQSRGTELQKVLEVYIKDTTGNYVTAIEGTDYDLTFGAIAPIASSLIGVRFIKSAEYRLNLKVAGYNSFNNPYAAIAESRTLVSSNENQVVYYINSVTTNITNTITFPKINANINAAVTLSSDPFSTYENNSFTVTGQLDLTTGSWIELDNNTQISTTRSLTEGEWLNEINSRCDILLEVKDVNNIITVPTKTGLGPHTYALPEGEFTAKFKTIER